MVKSQEHIYFFVIFIVLIPLSRSGSFVTVTEDEAVRLDFPYPCDSNKVTVQIANRLPFYNSAMPGYKNLPFYQLSRFSVTDTNCSVQVDINPVKRSDEATYICQEYKDGEIQIEFTRIRLNVNYPPGKVHCTFSTNYVVFGDWVPLQCEVSVGSLAGEFYCYQDSKRLPPQSKVVESGETMKQTIWASKEYPIFCCSNILDRLKDRCECKDFVWDPKGDIYHTNTIIDPCPATTPGPVETSSQYPEREIEDSSQVPQLIESLNMTDTNTDKSSVNCTAILWVSVSAIGIMIVMLVIILMRLYVVEKTNKQLQKCQIATIYREKKKMEELSPTISQEKELLLYGLSITNHSIARPNTWS